MKHLLYTTIGYGKDYVQLLVLFLASLQQHQKTTYTLCIMCDRDFVEDVQKICSVYSHMPFIFFAQPNSKTAQEASMHKVHIFDLPNIDEFTNIFYVDLDCLFFCPPDMFLEQIVKPDILYVGDDLCYKQNGLKPHHDLMWSLQNYTQEELAEFEAKNVEPFNAGCFLFQNTPNMRKDFENVCEMIRTWKGDFFFEQSFMNVYFNKKGNTDRFLFNSERYVMFPNPFQKYTNCIVHFCGGAGNGKEKFENMKYYWDTYSIHNQTIYFENRKDMIQSIITPHSNVLEIGVFEGEFAEVMYNCNPQTLFLIDPWTKLSSRCVSGDVDGNNVKEVSTENAYKLVKQKFENKPKVMILQEFSQDIAHRLANNSFHVVYIDGDHSYEGVKRDLENYYPKLIPGGWMCGHDYEMNMKKAKTAYDFGVRRAVDEFCRAHGCHIQYKALDGCVSFAFQKK